ncbi:MAG: GSCFA domain-containing protein [Prevotella sp.]|nr:GSCFA domain-containing protein [Prevotella sp.]
MELRTIVNIPKAEFEIPPCEKMLFVGSCFADNMGRRFLQEQFRAEVNPFGVMYNPASVLHSIQRLPIEVIPNVAVLTLGTNHVYILKSSGEIVDNCAKRPQSMFREEELTVEACADYLMQTIQLLRLRNPQVKVILTVSPIRYAKYGFHGSQLSKATLLLAVEKTVKILHSKESPVCYFPAYEIVNDELRDYRFYKEDMLHPSDQAVEYIYQRFAETYFSKDTFLFLQEWKPIKEALGHHPFHPESAEYHDFMEKTKKRLQVLSAKYPNINTDIIQFPKKMSF